MSERRTKRMSGAYYKNGKRVKAEEKELLRGSMDTFLKIDKNCNPQAVQTEPSQSTSSSTCAPISEIDLVSENLQKITILKISSL